MEFQTLRKSHKKQIIIGALAVCAVGGILSFNQKYKMNDIILSKESISNTKTIAMYKSEDGTNYTEINEIPSSGYTINEEKSYCTTDNKTKVTGKIKTINGNHVIANLKRSDKCYVWFDKQATASDTILAGITVKDTTPNFGSVATSNEGVFKVADGMYGGTSYYWRGAVTNNYVTFAGKCWRIVRINGDGSIRLIYDGSTCHANGSNADSIAKTSIAYNSSYNNSSYVGWTYTASTQRTTGGTSSNAKSQLESWYSGAITGTNATKVADGKYCNDRNVKSGQTWVATGTSFQYAAYQRLYDNKTPTLSCPTGDVYTLKVGLITADEVSFAGGVYGQNNTSYYLYNGQNYWTMSPFDWDGYAYVFRVYSDGSLNARYVHNTWGLRPVINLRSDVTISSGDGTQSNPYVVS